MDLWVLPGPSQSQWFGRLDWYLNWQMSKGLAVERRTASADLFRLIEEYGLSYPPVPDVSTPLLIGAHGRLPTRRCMVLQAGAELRDWFQSILEIASSLKVHDLRVFLPSGVDAERARVAWPPNSNLQVRFSSDEEAL